MSDNWFYRLTGFTRGKYWLRNADDAMRKDQRPPVIYLRSFADELGEYSGKRFFGNWFARDMLGIPPSEEQRIFAEHMQLIGPYIAIGRPSEPFPELGAARKYVSDDEWRQVVGELIDRAAAVVVQAGRTSGLAWEIGQLIVRAPPRKVLLILPRWQSEYDAFRARVWIVFCRSHCRRRRQKPAWWRFAPTGRAIHWRRVPGCSGLSSHSSTRTVFRFPRTKSTSDRQFRKHRDGVIPFTRLSPQAKG